MPKRDESCTIDDTFSGGIIVSAETWFSNRVRDNENLNANIYRTDRMAQTRGSSFGGCR